MAKSSKLEEVLYRNIQSPGDVTSIIETLEGIVGVKSDRTHSADDREDYETLRRIISRFAADLRKARF